MLCGCSRRDDANHDKENQPRNVVTKVATTSSSSSTSITTKKGEQVQLFQHHDNKILIHYQLGCSLQEQGKMWEAADIFRKIIVIHPHHFDALLTLANILHELDHTEEAEKFYVQALSIRPAHACYYSLGYLYQDRGDFDKAVASFQAAAKLTSSHPVMQTLSSTWDWPTNQNISCKTPFRRINEPSRSTSGIRWLGSTRAMSLQR